MTKEEHKKRHKELNNALDELAANWIGSTGGLPSEISLLDFMLWSGKQAKNPDHDPRGPK